MEANAISNTGPIIHLSEINLTETLKIFKTITIPLEVSKEIKKHNIPIPKNIKIISIDAQSKNIVNLLTNQYNLDMGESEAIALTIQTNSDYFLTDDLDARITAKVYNLKVHGTIGIILRAFKEKIINKELAITKIKEMHSQSSLFITNDLIEEAIKAIQNYKNSN
ncbi:MAG: DUF3368 domain-containing protein [Nanoarchaeota archaeon]